MGANQSYDSGESHDAKGAGRRSGTVKTCSYELLGVDRQATEDEIKKAYRKKALELHPDRNYGNVEQTTKAFADVQSAYEILSDPQERAWYDSHRDAILRDEDDASGEHYEHNVRITTANDIMKIFMHFRGKLDFSDSSTGFYSKLADVFVTLAEEERVACEWEDLDPVDYPSFGHANDDYDDAVKPFYAAWSGFATKKTFSWEDVYRLSDAPDRRVRRMMEKENKRLRGEGIREFNEAVQSLVGFVKKRDPRYKPNFQTEADRQKIMRDKAAAQAARSRAANLAKQAQQEEVPEWMKSRELPETEISDDAEEGVKEQFECVVCKKSFKSEKQYEAHEKSRKHVRAVQHIQRQMQNEDQNLRLDEPGEGKNDPHEGTNGHTDIGESDKVPGRTNSRDQTPEHSEIEHSDYSPEPPSNIGTQDGFEGGLKESVNGHEELSPTHELSASSSDDENTTREKVGEPISGEHDKLNSTASGSRSDATEIDHVSKKLASESLQGDSDPTPQPKMGKAKEKRAKKAAQKMTATAEAETSFKCATCQASFPSKTRLFNHIKDFGHAQFVAKPAKSGKGKKK
ncbi:hypothetical protein P7C71_g2749, partial [Lecanoromycetidae sp. Uapishka_2]